MGSFLMMAVGAAGMDLPVPPSSPVAVWGPSLLQHMSSVALRTRLYDSTPGDTRAFGWSSSSGDESDGHRVGGVTWDSEMEVDAVKTKLKEPKA